MNAKVEKILFDEDLIYNNLVELKEKELKKLQEQSKIYVKTRGVNHYSFLYKKIVFYIFF